jgi:DNA-binding beta-propeller fold protein YncE
LKVAARGWGRWGRGKAASLGAALLLVAGLSPACATRWGLRTAAPNIALQWPFPPNRPKVTFERSLTGFSRSKGSASAWSAFVYGNRKENQDAFVLPVAVSVGSDQRIAVADMGRKCAHLFLPAQSKYLRLTGSNTEKIASPVAVIFDERLNLYVSDSSGKIFVFGPGGEFLRAQGMAGSDPLRRPTGLAYSPEKKLLYVVDTLANRVYALDPAGGLAFSFGGRGEGEGRFNFPTHIFRSPAGELYVTDALDFRIDIFDEMGKPAGSFGHHGDGSGDMAMPKGLAVDRDGVVYVADGIFDNVQLFDRGGRFLLTVGRRGVDFGEFWLPAGVFLSNEGELYVCDTYNRRVQVFRVTVGYEQSAS